MARSPFGKLAIFSSTKLYENALSPYSYCDRGVNNVFPLPTLMDKMWCHIISIYIYVLVMRLKLPNSSVGE